MKSLDIQVAGRGARQKDRQAPVPHAGKVFGVGMSRTGTSTLGYCFKALGFVPHKSYDAYLKQKVCSENSVTEALAVAEQYRSFQDSPWYWIFRQLDERFPGSKFVLTTRKDAETQAQSAWRLLVQKGKAAGGPSDEFLRNQMRVYEKHNRRVLEYFAERPDDLLVVCWEKGDGWDALCGFLGVPLPGVRFPYSNASSTPGNIARKVWRRLKMVVRTA